MLSPLYLQKQLQLDTDFFLRDNKLMPEVDSIKIIWSTLLTRIKKLDSFVATCRNCYRHKTHQLTKRMRKSNALKLFRRKFTNAFE